jgi:hypothetical protein
MVKKYKGKINSKIITEVDKNRPDKPDKTDTI